MPKQPSNKRSVRLVKHPVRKSSKVGCLPSRQRLGRQRNQLVLRAGWEETLLGCRSRSGTALGLSW